MTTCNYIFMNEQTQMSLRAGLQGGGDGGDIKIIKLFFNISFMLLHFFATEYVRIIYMYNVYNVDFNLTFDKL